MKPETLEQLLARTVYLYAPRRTMSVINDRLQSYDSILKSSTCKDDDWMYRYYQGKYNGLAENSHSLGIFDGKSTYVNSFIGTIDSKDWSHYEI